MKLFEVGLLTEANKLQDIMFFYCDYAGETDEGKVIPADFLVTNEGVYFWNSMQMEHSEYVMFLDKEHMHGLYTTFRKINIKKYHPMGSDDWCATVLRDFMEKHARRVSKADFLLKYTDKLQ